MKIYLMYRLTSLFFLHFDGLLSDVFKDMLYSVLIIMQRLPLIQLFPATP